MRSKTTKKGIQILIGNGIYALAGLASAAIIIKKSSLEEYGTLVLLQAVFFTWSALTKPSTWQAVVKFSANHDLSIVANQSLSLETKTFWKTLAIIPLIAGMLNFLDYTEELTSIIIASTLWCSLIINNGTVIGVLRTKENYYNIALTQVLSSTQRIILALLLGQHVELYFLATTLIDALLWGYLIRMHVTKPFNKKSNNILCFDVKLFSSFSWWGTLHSALDLPVMHLDKILVMSLLGPAAAGALDLLKKVAQLPGQISAPANQIMLKKYSIFVQSKNIDGIRKTTITSAIALLLIYA